MSATIPAVLAKPAQPTDSNLITATRCLNGLKALTLLPRLARALDRGAAVASSEEIQIELYAAAAEVRNLLSETP